MKTQTAHYQTHSLTGALTQWIQKIFQSPDYYPIKYYKKGSRFRRHRDFTMIK